MSAPRCWIFSMYEPAGISAGAGRKLVGANDATGACSPVRQWRRGRRRLRGRSPAGGWCATSWCPIAGVIPAAHTSSATKMTARRIIGTPAVVGRSLGPRRTRRRARRGATTTRARAAGSGRGRGRRRAGRTMSPARAREVVSNAANALFAAPLPVASFTAASYCPPSSSRGAARVRERTPRTTQRWVHCLVCRAEPRALASAWVARPRPLGTGPRTARRNRARSA